MTISARIEKSLDRLVRDGQSTDGLLEASEGEYSPHVLQVTGTAAELLAFAEGIRDAVHLVEMRQLAESMEPIPGTVTS